MMKELFNAEYTKTFTVEGGIERFQRLVRMFADDASMEMSIIVDAAAEVLNRKYGLDWAEIEKIEIAAY